MIKARPHFPALASFCSLIFSSVASAAESPVFSFALVGDGGDWGSNAQSVRDSVIRLKEKDLLMPGDNLYPVFETYADQWDPWRSQGLQFKAVAIGNHHGGYSKEVAYFQMPGEHYSMALANGQVQLTVLNSDNKATASTQAAFFENILKTNTAPIHLVMYHHPSLSITGDHTWQERKAFQQAIRPLLFQYRNKITAVLNGHDHIASLHEFNDLPIIVSGAVQDTRAPESIDNSQEGIHVKSRWLFQESPHWVRLKVTPSSPLLSVDYIRAGNDQVVCSLQIQTGKPAVLGNNCN